MKLYQVQATFFEFLTGTGQLMIDLLQLQNLTQKSILELMKALNKFLFKIIILKIWKIKDYNLLTLPLWVVDIRFAIGLELFPLSWARFRSEIWIFDDSAFFFKNL